MANKSAKTVVYLKILAEFNLKLEKFETFIVLLTLLSSKHALNQLVNSFTNK